MSCQKWSSRYSATCWSHHLSQGCVAVSYRVHPVSPTAVSPCIDTHFHGRNLEINQISFNRHIIFILSQKGEFQPRYQYLRCWTHELISRLSERIYQAQHECCHWPPAKTRQIKSLNALPHGLPLARKREQSIYFIHVYPNSCLLLIISYYSIYIYIHI